MNQVSPLRGDTNRTALRHQSPNLGGKWFVHSTPANRLRRDIPKCVHTNCRLERKLHHSKKQPAMAESARQPRQARPDAKWPFPVGASKKKKKKTNAFSGATRHPRDRRAAPAKQYDIRTRRCRSAAAAPSPPCIVRGIAQHCSVLPRSARMARYRKSGPNARH